MTADVAVVGAGPTGLMLACELRAAGASVVVLERAEAPDTGLRAPAITERTIEALERHRVLDLLVGETARYRAEHGGTGTLAPDLRVNGTRALPIRQDIVERALERHARALGTDVRRGHELEGLAEARDRVELRTRHRDATAIVRARFAVGCDGGHSLMRRATGIGFPGNAATLTGYQAEVVVAGAGTLTRGWHRTPTGIASYELCPSRIVSIEFDGPPADRSTPVTLDEVQASLRRTSGTSVALSDPRSLTRFTDNARLADSYRRGRVLLAGDAAHVHAPFGGQGLNLGVQDAVNLGWKLAATLRGWAPDGLLDGYELERRPVAEEVLRNVSAAVALLDPDDRMTAVHDLFADLRGLEAVRRHMHAKTAMVDLRYTLGGDTGDPLLGRAPRALRLAGTRGGGGVELARIARAGRGLLVVLGGGEPAARVALAWGDRIDIVAARVASAPPDAADATDARDLAALLLRPDGHVAWIGRGGIDEPSLRDALERTFGAASPRPARARRLDAGGSRPRRPHRRARSRGFQREEPHDDHR